MSRKVLHFIPQPNESMKCEVCGHLFKYGDGSYTMNMVLWNFNSNDEVRCNEPEAAMIMVHDE